MPDVELWTAISKISGDIGGLKQSIENMTNKQDAFAAKVDKLPCLSEDCALKTANSAKNNNWRKYILVGAGIGLVLVGGLPGMEKTIQVLAMLVKGG